MLVASQVCMRTFNTPAIAAVLMPRATPIHTVPLMVQLVVCSLRAAKEDRS
ncbi:hypothetical protein OH492_21990 [Vibrio chagasii]|nr:hypothetical protein [Vibrio chagasii]